TSIWIRYEARDASHPPAPHGCRDPDHGRGQRPPSRRGGATRGPKRLLALRCPPRASGLPRLQAEGSRRLELAPRAARRGPAEPAVRRDRGRREPERLVTPNLEIARRFLDAHGPEGRLLVGITGAHFYGFPSPDSDIDMKGIHLAKTREVVSLK